MAYFRCGQGAGGNELKILITTTDTSLYGQTITISKDGSTVGTTTFDNTGNAEYTVDEAGLYTVSCSGASESVLIEDEYEVSLSSIPDGKTVLPVNDIQTWLNCAGIFNKTTYTTLSEVLADTTTLLALINSNNAVDYMVRSHSWCDDVCADATAMTYIGANNYAADTLLADDNPGLVPTMMDNTTPSGECVASSSYSTARYPYKAFDKNATSYHNSTNNGAISAYYLGYTFPTAKTVKAATILANAYGANYYYDVALYAGNSLSGLTKISDTVRIQGAEGTETTKSFTVTNNTAYTTYVIKIEDSNTPSTNGSSFSLQTYEMQFYAKDGSWLESICNSQYFESVLNVKVPTMTSDITPSGYVASASSILDSRYFAYGPFDNGNKVWYSAQTNAHHWVQIEVPMAYIVKKISYSGRPWSRTHSIQASNDTYTWENFVTGITDPGSTVVADYTINNNTAYKYFRVYCTDTNNSYTSVDTLQFYGRAAS